jgi:hypothetical protein
MPAADPKASVELNHSRLRGGRWVREFLWGAPFLFLTVLFTVCFVPVFAEEASLDTSCFFSAGWAFVHHLRFGIDFLGSFGPFSFAVHNIYHPETFGWMIAAQCIVSAEMFFGLWAVGRNLRMHPLGVGLWAILFAMWDYRSFEDGHILTICLLPMLIRRTNSDRRDSAASYVVVLALAVAGLYKFTFLTLGSACLALLSVEDVFSRRPPKLGIWFTAMVVVLWRMAGQRIFDLPTYVSRSVMLASGYSESVGLPGSDPFFVPTVAILSALICCMVLARFWKENRLAAAIAFLTTTATLFVCFKEGCTRCDFHAYATTIGLMTVAWMLGPVFWIRWNRGAPLGRVVGVRLLVLFTIAVSMWRLDPSLHPSSFVTVDLPTVKSRLVTGLNWLHQGNTILNPAYEEGMAKIRASDPLPFRTGTVDAFSDSHLAVIAAGMDYHPRPISPGFQAWSPGLIEMNRRFLAGANAPENIFFQAQVVDHRFPSLDDGALWPELMTRYSPTEITDRDVLVLHRDPTPRHFTLTALSSRICRFDEHIPVPVSPSGILWAQIKLRQTFCGKLGTLMLRAPEVDIAFITADGVRDRKRLVPGMAETGFVLSPIVSDARGLLSLMTASPGLPVATDISIHVQPTNFIQNWFDPSIEITFQRLDVPAVTFPKASQSHLD